jgi:hypothetical protein
VSCGEDRTITNTASLTETDTPTTRTDPASVVVDCNQLTVSKTATPSYKRVWTWHVVKSSDAPPTKLAPGETFVLPYKVTYTASSADSEFAVSGQITVTSPAGAPTRTINSITDLYAGATAGIVSNCMKGAVPVTPPVAIAAGDTITCNYVATLAGKTTGTNVATATLQNVSSGTTNFTGSASVSDFGAPTTVIDESITVTDTYGGSTVTGTVNAPGPKEFTYSRQIGPYTSQECGDHLITNTADFTTNDTSTTGSSTVFFTVNVPCPTGCTLTQGYWKTHSIRGPAPFDDAWNLIEQPPYAPGDADGIKEAEAETFFFSNQTWYQVFWTPPSGGNAYYQLAHQYQAAVLNVLNGADPSVVSTTLNAALVLLNNPANTPTSIGALKGNAALRKQFVDLAGILGSYNTGTIGPGHCSEDKTISNAP